MYVPNAIVLGLILFPLIVIALPFTRSIVVKLTGKYLLRRRLAWVSLIATVLCVALVLIVLSVMSGWLGMFRASFKTMSGDIIVSRQSSSGFAGYEEIISRAKALPEVEAGVPLIRTAALLALPNGWNNYVMVVGVPIDEIDTVMDFSQSLWIQSDKLAERPMDLPVRKPSFDLWPGIDYTSITPNDKQTMRRKGIIIGSAVIGIRKDPLTRKMLWDTFLLDRCWAKLTVMPDSEEVGNEKSAINARTTPYFVVDGSHTQAFTHDNNVYVPFAQLQADLNLAGNTYLTEEPVDPKNPNGPTTQREMTEPARTTEIQFKLKPGTDMYAVKDKIQAIVDEVTGQSEIAFSKVTVKTWEEQQAPFLNAVENEITIMMTLFGLISLVQVLMIFCIFYTIVAEKTRDIGILKSIGASEWQVAQIFLTYGAAIGFVGGGLGVLIGWQFVKWINEIQDLITKVTGRAIYNSEIYQIDRLPDTISWNAAITIWVIGIAAAIGGAFVPAILASRKRPVESLRFE